MHISDYDYHLPDELIAQQPLERREASRMLVVDRSAGTFTDSNFSAFPEMLREGDVLVLNNTKVFPARLLGRSETGAAVEIFLVREAGPNTWESLARPARRLHVGKKVAFGEKLSGEIVDKNIDGRVVVRFDAGGELERLIDEVGRTPLPPYIKRDPAESDADRPRYQTVFAKKRGAIAAPTAGLHFTPEILDRARSRGVQTVEITLHVGYGTFEPVRAEDLSEHRVQPEYFELPEQAARTLNRAKDEGRRIIAVGTTTTRALETSAARHGGRFAVESGMADLTITPGYQFGAIDGLLTNFHLPKSSLLVLVSTFAGRELIMEAYRHAVASRYRFYSYGDCMLIV